MSKLKEQFGKRLKELREEQGLSQERLAEQAGLHRTTEGKIERGNRWPEAETIEKLANVLDVSYQELFQFEDES